MREYKFYKIDAFTEKPFEGNPCAVVLNADSLIQQEMQKIANEMNLAETAFVLESGKADFAARYFTPAEEIPFAGHPTISTITTLIEEGIIELNSHQTNLELELSVGVIPIEINKLSNGEYLTTLTQNPPEFLRTYSPDEVAGIFNLNKNDLLENYLPQTVSTGTKFLMVPVKDKNVLSRAVINIDKFAELKKSGDFLSIHLFSLEGFTKKGTTAARHFSIPPDLIEDPYTGSATGCMASYLWHYNLLEKDNFIAEQGHFMGRPGEGFVELVGTKGNIQGIKLSGSAVVVMEGVIKL